MELPALAIIGSSVCILITIFCFQFGSKLLGCVAFFASLVVLGGIGYATTGSPSFFTPIAIIGMIFLVIGFVLVSLEVIKNSADMMVGKKIRTNF